ncbi:MAG TPA: TetR/AcrR family transcriptional regulator [Alphaproteobacteria bacterium]|nr:TetR/AcrR family transcriptional regulator [Alphaproteobacteria bacterium]
MSTAPSGAAKKSSATRSRILAAARQAFARGGFEQSPMSLIARRAGIDKSSLYYFFRNKEDLFAAVTLDTWQKLSASVAKNLGARAGGARILSKACRDFIAISLAAGMASTRMELPPQSHPGHRQTLDFIRKTRKLALEFLARHRVPQPTVAHSIISNAIHAYVIHTCTGKPQPSAKRYCDYLAALFIK